MMRSPLENFNANPQFSNLNHNNGSGYGHGGPRAALGNGIIQPNVRPISNRSSSSGSGNSNNNTSSKRAPSASKPSWSAGPGIPMSGFPYHVGGGGVNESVGPRFNNMHRRASGNTSSGGNSCASSTANNDDVSSIAVSTSGSGCINYLHFPSSLLLQPHLLLGVLIRLLHLHNSTLCHRVPTGQLD